MQNFTFYNPVKIIFGKGEISKLPELLPENAKIMVLYGGGSIKKNGVYNQVVEALDSFSWVEFGGIEPNPSYETCMNAVAKIKTGQVDFLLAVGGGSVLDATKFIAAAALWHGNDPWDILQHSLPVTTALPLASVMTLPATGSEMNCNAVISRTSTQEKLALHQEAVYPIFSILDPETTYSLPSKQTSNGIVDAFIHVVEQYITCEVNSPLQDRFAEAILRTLIEEGPKVLQEPNNYEARGNIFWASSLALNGLISAGVVEDWSTHQIGHEITAYYGLDHARTLACVLPANWSHNLSNKKQKLAQYARRVWGLKCDDDTFAAQQAISLTVAFFNSLDVSCKLEEYGINAMEAATRLQARFESRKSLLGERQNIDAKAVFEIVSKA